MCPGRRVSLNCSVEPARSVIQWRIWCQCSADRSGSCRDTCTPMMTTIVNTGDSFYHGNVCASAEYNPAITYTNNFTTVSDQNNNIFVPFSMLSIYVPLDFQQLGTTRLCLQCEDSYRNLQVLGENFDE